MGVWELISFINWGNFKPLSYFHTPILAYFLGIFSSRWAAS